jgi:aminopeptidase N
MKRLATLIISLWILSPLSSAQDRYLLENHKSEMLSYEQRSNFRRSSGLGDYDVLFHRLYLKLNPNKNYVEGSVFTQFLTNSDHDSIGFDLHSAMTVDSVIYHGYKISFAHLDNKLTIFLNFTIPEFTEDSIEVFYQGKPAQSGRYFTNLNHQTGPSIHTLSEPYGALYWWPCKQTLTDKIDSIDILVETDTAFRAASNGLLTSENLLNDSTIVYHWKHRYPIATYLVAVAVTNFEEHSFYAKIKNGTDSVFVQNYIWPESLEDAKIELPEVSPMLNLFDSLFGTYPFIKEKYGHAQFLTGGGMEHQTMSFMGSFDYSLVAHELAHQWFGDQVTCGSWESLWINEGFATYLTALCFEHLQAEGEFKKRLEAMRNLVLLKTNGSVFPVDTVALEKLFSQRLTYQKAALMIHMVRWNLGDSFFYQGIRNFLQASQHNYGFAVTNDIKSHWEAVSGKNLDEFFEDWFYGEGYPIYDVIWSQDKDELSVSISQTTSHHSVSFFENPVPIRFNGINRDTTLIFDPKSNFESYFHTVPFEIESVEFDPDLWILSKSDIRFKVLKGFNIFPNPFIDNATVSVGNSFIRHIEITDLTGRQVFYESYLDSSPQNELNIKLDFLIKGTYVLKCTTNKESVVTKIIKSH